MNLATLKAKLKTVIYPVFSDYFLPSKDESGAMRDNLYLFGIGGFANNHFYWSSTETSATNASDTSFPITYGPENLTKTNHIYVRACRAFTSTTNYNLRDIGPAGGLIFWKSGNDYLEAAPSDQSVNQAWSNITNAEIGITAQGTAIGTGQANTTAIINQVGHTSSAAKLCDDLVVISTVPLIGEVLFDWKEYNNEKYSKTYPLVLWSLSGAKFSKEGRTTAIQKIKTLNLSVFILNRLFDLDKIDQWDLLEGYFDTYLTKIHAMDGLSIENIADLKGQYLGIDGIDSEIGITYEIVLKIWC